MQHKALWASAGKRQPGYAVVTSPVKMSCFVTLTLTTVLFIIPASADYVLKPIYLGDDLSPL